MEDDEGLNTAAYWRTLDELAAACDLEVDRPKGTAHPRYPELIYPLDYGYLKGTCGGDGNEIDCWVGSLTERAVTGSIFTVDRIKRDMEGKLLIGCTLGEMWEVHRFHNSPFMSAMLLIRAEGGQRL